MFGEGTKSGFALDVAGGRCGQGPPVDVVAEFGQTKTMSEAIEIVRAYLDAMEARDLDLARTYLGADFAMTFPGGVTFKRPEELVEWSRDRYRSVRKVYDLIDETQGEAGPVVYCSGRLQGEWPDGSSFSDIRFIDRFELRDGKIVDQQVWNDLSEYQRTGNA